MNATLEVTPARDLLTMRSPQAARHRTGTLHAENPPSPPTCYDRMSRKIVTRRSPIHGNGVFAARKLAPGVELIEYQGRLMTHAQADRLYEGGVDTGHTFLFTLNERYIIDANVDGNEARWLNHSCAPNCQAVWEESADGNPKKDRILIETLREIAPGEELTYDYGISLPVRQTARMKALWACRCGAPECSGTMLKPKR